MLFNYDGVSLYLGGERELVQIIVGVDPCRLVSIRPRSKRDTLACRPRV